MNPKHTLVFAVLLFVGVLVLAFLGVIYLLPGYLSLRDGTYRNAGASVIRVRDEGVADLQATSTATSSEAESETP